MTRADRRYRTQQVVQRRARQARALNWGADDTAPDDRMLGRWRRHAPLDCGRPRCGLCSGPSYREERRRLRRAWTARRRRGDYPRRVESS
jgi:hypothetical protein